MLKYKLLYQDSSVIRLNDMATIPADPNNADRIEFEKWLADGNTPEPADNHWPSFNKQRASDLLAESDWTQLPDAGLSNAAEFKEYRAKLRVIAIDPPATLIEWPDRPRSVWQ